MSELDDFWTAIKTQLTLLTTARTADDVIRICPSTSDVSEGFFAGSGGDDSVEEALDEAGWTHEWRKAHYYWCMIAPDGSMITYIEGDLYRGNRPPLPEEGD